jgi:hypothetical protein
VTNVTDIIRQLSDDQLALLGCLGALSTAFLLLWTSFRLNAHNQSPNAVPAPVQNRDDAERTDSAGQRHAA